MVEISKLRTNFETNSILLPLRRWTESGAFATLND